MTRKTIITAAVLAATTIGGAAYAHSDHGQGGKPGQRAAQGMMMQGGGTDMMGGMSGMMGMMQRMHEKMTQMVDENGDGNVTPEEMRTRMQAMMSENDSNGDGSLSIDEFETLHSSMMREIMVDRFQDLDADGDGAVTSEEMMAPAARMERMNKMREGMMQRQGEADDDQSKDN